MHIWIDWKRLYVSSAQDLSVRLWHYKLKNVDMWSRELLSTIQLSGSIHNMTWTYNVILVLCVIGISAAYRRDSFNKKHRLAVYVFMPLKLVWYKEHSFKCLLKYLQNWSIWRMCKGSCQQRFSGFCPLRGSPPPLNGKSVWEKKGFFPLRKGGETPPPP